MKWVADSEDITTFLEILPCKNDTKHKMSHLKHYPK